jgi:TonB-dependent SusC/RagA subfamily outer membrane receptor
VVVKPKPAVSTEIPVILLAEIRGKVADAAGKPLQGVSILNKKTRKGATSDPEGNFIIHAATGDILQFSFVGYRSVTYKVGATDAPITLSMEVEVTGLNEMVLIGYGSSKAKDLTGSVSTVATKDIQDIPFNTVDNALAGKAAGVQVTKTDGTPGGAVRIRVRGSTSLLGGNDPLYVIDGVPLQVQSNFVKLNYDVGTPAANDINASNAGIGAGMSSGFVNGLNSIGGLNIDDIESISILKDASSTAIYGSKAANGVIIINTKRGKKDMKPQITGNYYSTTPARSIPNY